MKNEAVSNIIMIPDVNINNSECSIHVNNKYTIKLPLLVVLANSPVFTREYICDFTKQDFYIDFEFSGHLNDTIITKIHDFMLCREITLNNEEEIIEFAQFGQVLGNETFITPYKQLCSESDKDLNTGNVISSLKRKVMLSLENRFYQKEIEIIASNFVNMYSDIVTLSKDEIYSDVISCIVDNNKLKLNTEDDLLRFVIELSQHDKRYCTLFESVHLEYCTIKCIQEFIEFVITNICQDRYTESIITCMSNRLLTENLPKNPPFIKNRHKPPYVENHTEITDSDPLNGILRREGTKGNVLLTNPANDNIERLIKADDSFDFRSSIMENYYIEASLKDHRSFKITKYMIRGRKYKISEGNNHLKNWKLEGLRKSDNKWIELDHQEDKPLECLQYRVFPVSCDDELVSVKLTQTIDEYHQMGINAFDIFGYLENK